MPIVIFHLYIKVCFAEAELSAESFCFRFGTCRYSCGEILLSFLLWLKAKKSPRAGSQTGGWVFLKIRKSSDNIWAYMLPCCSAFFPNHFWHDLILNLIDFELIWLSWFDWADLTLSWFNFELIWLLADLILSWFDFELISGELASSWHPTQPSHSDCPCCHLCRRCHLCSGWLTLHCFSLICLALCLFLNCFEGSH